MTKLEDDVRKLLGLKPHDSPSNICWNDNYFAKSLEEKYGEKVVRKEADRLRKLEMR